MKTLAIYDNCTADDTSSRACDKYLAAMQWRTRCTPHKHYISDVTSGVQMPTNQEVWAISFYNEMTH